MVDNCHKIKIAPFGRIFISGGDGGVVIPTHCVRGPLSLRCASFRTPSNCRCRRLNQTSIIVDIKNHTTRVCFFISGGDGGVRTPDTVSCIRDFESRAFNQLCHISGACIIPPQKSFARALCFKIVIFYRLYNCRNQFILVRR